MSSDLHAYIKTGKAESHFQLLRTAIHKGSWNYPEDKLEIEFNSIKWIQKKYHLFKIVGICAYCFLGLAALIGVLSGGMDNFTIVIISVGCVSLFYGKFAIEANAKKFLYHIRKLENGGIKID